MIVLSDGQSPHAGVRELIGELVRANVTISTVGVGRGAGQELLAAMAQQGGGRFYFSQDGTDVPQIFARDTQSFAKASNVRKVFPVSRGSSFLPLPGVQLSQAPPLLSLIKLRVRPGAQTYLHSRDQMPVLTAKRFGQGTIAAFASDVGPGLSQAWGAWSDFPRLWLAIARAVARQE